MSRYFQSSYHGLNDYKKYRQQRLSKNVDISIPNGKSPLTQDTSFHPESRRNSVKEHLQTFGKQTSRQESKMQEKYADLYSKYKQPEGSKRQETSAYDSYSFLSKRGLTNDIGPTKSQQDKVSEYIKGRYGAEDRLTVLNEQTLGKKLSPPQGNYISSNLTGNLMNRQKYSRNYEIDKDRLISQSFEDSIITRRKNYQSFNSVANIDSSISSKAYNYSSKIRNREQEGINSKQFQPKERRLSRDINFEDKHKSKPEIITDVSLTSPYRSRNQMIMERLNLVKKDDRSDASYCGSKRQFIPIQENSIRYETKRELIASQIKTAQVTPQKPPLNTREDRNASEQRRKSLIQKSQMLKEKLSRLNASSNIKAAQNQENKLAQKMSEKQNITQNYTPKRYITNSFRANHEDSNQNQKSISKRLNFDEALTKAEPLKTRNYSTNSDIKSKTTSCHKEPLTSENVGEGALRKISELNERINSRLESILKNYG